jgi:predicted MFS family arabinose efflux permease
MGQHLNSSRMTGLERRAAFSLAGIFALRMLGLFLILPVFALYSEHLAAATPLLVGIAIGAYGLTQALLQIPFGMLSDRIGRKPVILGGLVLFALGSAVAALGDNIYVVILGRALQGSGAIAAAVMALAADLTREEHRTKAMAVIGMSIGAAFAVALVLGPVLDHWIGVPGIFWLTALLAVGGMLVVTFLVPTPAAHPHHSDAEAEPAQFREVLSIPDLLRLDYGILTLHMVLTSVFLVVPLELRNTAGMDAQHHWLLYLPVLLGSILAMVPFIIIAEKHQRMKQVFLGAITVLGLALGGLFLGRHSLWGTAVALWAFFTAFNLLEASLPSLVSKVAPASSKGTAMGVYSSSQFAGAFLGGLLGGGVHEAFGISGVFVFGAAAAALWLAVAAGMRPPSQLSHYLLRVGVLSDTDARALAPRLAGVPGVAEAVVVAEEGVAYLKVDRRALDVDALGEFSAADA